MELIFFLAGISEIGDISDEVLASKLNKLGTDLDCPIQSHSLETTIDLLKHFCTKQGTTDYHPVFEDSFMSDVKIIISDRSC